ncbi:phosphocholine-specific phospholipase C [Galbibacter pacificus]|uniref:phospholipase C n=1 Tax=Galbibacter pacificus TaxID=2996052 RepID=A0ABT6FUD3_9FLAO|nr:phospholipase C, phosphocholine-specific [Galbibacter pacificus]MDG3583651.1 phospholipase C, phosphocholine-specific [Galbibacter pacificus]MDG3586873.1 phospholipase C, phosphocholine-specific [Galbibacter pacificus]
MDTRRDFLKKATLFTGGMSVLPTFPNSIKRALQIDPEKGSNFYDAEHIVLLMQENRSFDHCYGSLRGVRGFNDPRAIKLPNKNPVWLQHDEKGRTFAPFRLNMKETKATWMGGLPHSWTDQVDARNNGKYDKWLFAKQPGRKEYKDIPFTLGYYNREDLPFYYAFADAFTVFDQHFCSSLTGTTTNRLFFWSGTHKDREGFAHVRNSEVGWDREINWKTFPERLQDHDIPWKVYQNEISFYNGLEGEDESYLANFTDNNLEWYSQFNVRYTKGYQNYLKNSLNDLPVEIDELEEKIKETPKRKVQPLQNELEEKKAKLKHVQEESERWNPLNFEKLSDYQKQLHQRAFVTNSNDPDYHETEEIAVEIEGEKETLKVPKGDILDAFRKDVNAGTLPTVSWLVAPQKFSDHPSAPWFGAWYVSEVLDILTKDPEVWKKTIFILTYDENDGYFDHVPPFVAPNPKDAHLASKGMDLHQEYVTLKEELVKNRVNENNARESPVGLGYRVPMVVASPWTRGGWVNSEVCDITSTIQLMENFIQNKYGKDVKETNISEWRRCVSGDLTSAFRTFKEDDFKFSDFVKRNEFMGEVINARAKKLPSNYRELSDDEISTAKKAIMKADFLPQQEPGVKDSCALTYELYVDGKLNMDTLGVEVFFEASNNIFGEKAKGAPFNVYAFNRKNEQSTFNWPITVKPGDKLLNNWSLKDFREEEYQLSVHGPNGFYRALQGNANDPDLNIDFDYEKNTKRVKRVSGNIMLHITNNSNKPLKVVLEDCSYGQEMQHIVVKAGKRETIILDVNKNYNWYDFKLTVEGNNTFKRRYAGRVEVGKASKTDPYMGRVQ